MKRRLLSIILVFILSLGICSCEKAPDNQPSDAAEEVLTIDEEALYSELFDRESEIIIEISISDAQLKKLATDYMSYTATGVKPRTYRMAECVVFTVNGERYEIEQVGIRIKGNTSRSDFYSPAEGLYNLQHYRLSFNETFDGEEYGEDAVVWESDAARRERKNRTFATLEKMELKWNNSYDSSYISEIYSADMLRAFGGLSQRITLCNMRLGDINCGIYKLYEPVDDVFLRRYLGHSQDNGDLYKIHWGEKLGSGGQWNGANFTFEMGYRTDGGDGSSRQPHCEIKTNENTAHNAMRNLLYTINDENVTKEQFESVVDVESFITYAAVSYITGSPDDLRNNGNNTYIYFLPQSGKAVFIPYDNDHAYYAGWNPTGDHMLSVSPYTVCAHGHNTPQENPLFLLSVCAGGWYTEEYRQKLIEIADSQWMKPHLITACFETYRDTYEKYALPSGRFSDRVWLDGLKFETPEEYVSHAYYLIERRETMLSMIDDYTSEHAEKERLFRSLSEE